MGLISSTIKLMDASTSVIQRTISSMSKIVDVMEEINRSADMPNLDAAFDDIRSDIGAASLDLVDFRHKLEGAGDEGERSTGRTSSGFGLVSKSIIVVNQGLQLLRSGYQMLDDMMGKADGRSSADARLNIIRDELRTQEDLERQVMAVANASRASYEDTATLVARIGREDYFKGQNDKALAFAQTVTQGLKVSGASASESSGAITQLSQALASGALRGDEFNSIMENGSVLGEMLAESLGVTKGELRAMAAEGKLTTDVVVSGIMQQADVIENQFKGMPITFAESKVQMENMWSQMLNNMSEPGQGLSNIIALMQEFIAWMDTTDGQAFFDGIAAGIGFILEGMFSLLETAGEIYTFFSDNWSTIEPIMVGLAVAVGGLTAAYLIYKGVMFAATVVEAIHAAGQSVTAGTILATTLAQWGLNAAMLASPTTWIIIGIIALIAIIVALAVWINKLWTTNVDFKVGVIKIWNDLLGFFDQVPIFFQWVGNGILDAFSHIKVGTANILQSIVNNAIQNINWLIDKVNKIPGVSFQAVESVTFGAETAVEEEAKRQQRAADLAGTREAAAQRAAQRESDLAAKEVTWRAEAAAKEAELQAAEEENQAKGESAPVNSPDFGTPELGGGTLDKVGKVGKIEDDVDISNQSLVYLRDIAEIYALESVNAYSTVAVESMNDARLSAADADLLRSSAGGDTKVYYLNYSGGVNIRNNVKKGENWDDIRREMEEEIDNDIESGLSDIDRVVNG